MSTFISLIFSILIAYLIYKCFEKYGFFQALIVSFALDLIQALINNGFNYLLRTIFLTLIISVITTAVDYLIYTKTNSFITYLIVSIIVGILIALIPALLIAGLLV